jgi:hypothetical protein
MTLRTSVKGRPGNMRQNLSCMICKRSIEWGDRFGWCQEIQALNISLTWHKDCESEPRYERVLAWIERKLISTSAAS